MLISIIIISVIGFGGSILYNWLIEKVYQDRTDEQKKAIRYFIADDVFAQVWYLKPFVILARACKLIPDAVTDSDYDEMLSEELKRLKLHDPEKALQKLGLIESIKMPIYPITFEGYKFDENVINAFDSNSFQKRGERKEWRSSKYEVFWIIASDEQLHFYSYLFNMTDDTKKERIESIFWKDIVKFATVSENKSVGYGWNQKTKSYKGKKIVEEHEFTIVVPGDKYICSVGADEKVVRTIQKMIPNLKKIKEGDSIINLKDCIIIESIIGKGSLHKQ